MKRFDFAYIIGTALFYGLYFMLRKLGFSISIMGLLNSKLIDYYFRLYSSNTQVSANELRSIPIIVDENIQKIVEDIQEGKKSLEELDNHVFNIYDLSKEEVNHVLDFYK